MPHMNLGVNQFQWPLPVKQFGCLEMNGITGANPAPLQLLGRNFTFTRVSGSCSFERGDRRQMDGHRNTVERKNMKGNPERLWF